MVLELHVWGVAFNLPSIDPECLAAIAYLKSTLPADEWILIPSNNPSVSPYGVLPALRHHDTWVAGQARILSYLRALSLDLNQNLGAKQEADLTAYTSFIESRGAPLLDLCLWVSSENYTNVTRYRINGLLTWPNSWTVPGRLRDRARRRSEHLGLSGLDVDAAKAEQEKKKDGDEGLTAHIPERLRKNVQKGVSGVLGKEGRVSQFRLAAVTDAFMEPMDELLKDGREWLLDTDEPTSLDCLAIGYLALMMRAEVPHAWLRTALEGRYVRLGEWVERKTGDLFGKGNEAWTNLPWQAPEERTWKDLGSDVIENFAQSLPVIGPKSLHPVVKATSERQDNESHKKQQVTLVRLKNQQLFYGQVVASCLAVAATTGLLFWAGWLRFPKRSPQKVRRDFGAAGAMLGLG